MNKHALIIFLILVIAITVSALPPEKKDPKLHGGHFAISDVNINGIDSNILIESTNIITTYISANPNFIELIIEPSSIYSTSTITISGLQPSTTYYLYKNSYANGISFTTSYSESFEFVQDISTPTHIWIQTQPSTIFINDDSTGGDCEAQSVGTWDASTKTCTLTQNINESIEIASSGVTLDCANNTVSGNNTGWGILVSGQTNVTVKNCVVKNFFAGIASIGFSAGNMFTNNTLESNERGFRLVQSYYNDAIGNSVNSNNQEGVSMLVTADNNISNNVIHNNPHGISADYTTTSLFENNDIISSNLNNKATIWSIGEGIISYEAHNNLINGNNIMASIPPGKNAFGVYIHTSANNTLTNNSISNFTVGVRALNTQSNELTNNTIKQNELGIYSESTGSNTLYHNNLIDNSTQLQEIGSNNWKSPTANEGSYWSDYTGEDLDGDGIGDTLLPHQGVDYYPYTEQNGWIHSCFDGVQNGDEEGVDCGGSCSIGCVKCAPAITNGNSFDKIDVVFVGSGFPTLQSFKETVDEVIRTIHHLQRQVQLLESRPTQQLHSGEL